MTDAMLVVLLLAFIWAAILLPPAAGARAAREAEFLGSIRPDGHDDVDQARFRPAMTANARRRQVLGGLVVAIGATLVLGLLPTFRLLLVVHLLLVNSCLAYVGLLVHMRDEQAARARMAIPAWRRTAEVPAGTAFTETVHPYAYADGSLAELASADDWSEDEVGYDEEAAYAYSAGYADGYGEWDEMDDTEAAYVDEALAQPA